MCCFFFIHKIFKEKQIVVIHSLVFSTYTLFLVSLFKIKFEQQKNIKRNKWKRILKIKKKPNNITQSMWALVEYKSLIG